LQHTSDVKRAQRFGTLAVQVARGIARLERDEVCCGDFTLQQFEALRLLRDAGPTAVGTAARGLGIDISTASRNLALLERGGYVRRRRSADDGRQVVFALAAKGTATLDSLCCDERVVFASLLARVPTAEREGVVHALEVLAAALTPAPEQAACCPSGACTPTQEKAR
jgi:DNA-binding MarR family transcriptional regulator